MLTELSFEHFKCFSEISIPLKPLSLFCGINSVGKSSAIHGLALLNQTISENEWNQDIHLNGNNVSLGTSEDVVNRSSGRHSFSIAVKSKQASIKWTAGDSLRKDNVVAKINKIESTSNGSSTQWRSTDKHPQRRVLHRLLPIFPLGKHRAKDLTKRISKIKYISADRLGPCETYALPSNGNITSVGAKGEWTAHFLNECEGDPANELLSKGIDGKTIRKTVEHWMDRLFPGFGFSIQRIPGTGLLSLQIRTSQSSPMFRPQNVGFGLTHVLPIITACASSQNNDTIIVENPEAHLHPAGQSMMGLIIGITAASGTQIIVETHSDHILNGIRKAVSREIIPSNDVIFNFFHHAKERDDADHAITTLTCDQHGRMSNWPKMFFDQMQTDLLELA